MKIFSKFGFLFIKICLLLFPLCIVASCSHYSSTNNDSSIVTLKWIMPAKGKFDGTSAVYESVNNIISEHLPEIRVDFITFNKYDYKDKLNLYLSSGEQFDIAWACDKYLPYIREYSKNSFKILDHILNVYGQDILNALPEETKQNMRLGNHYYYIPTVYDGKGMIPYLKIPKELAQYINVQELFDAFSRENSLTEKPLQLLDSYLEKLGKLGLLGEGVDAIELAATMPYISYDTIRSTYDKYCYRIADSTGEIYDVADTEGGRLLSLYFKKWYDKNYIRRDINIVNKKRTDAPNNYCLSAVWGFWNNGGLQTVLSEDVTDDYIYIQMDNLLHRSKMDAAGMVFIPKIALYPNESIMLLNLFFKEPELYKTLTYGFEGEHYIETDNQIMLKEAEKSRYLMYPNIVPSPPNSWYSVSHENIIQTKPIKIETPMNGFRPIVSRAIRMLLSFLDTYRDGDIIRPDGRPNENSDTSDILDVLKNQAEDYLQNY